VLAASITAVTLVAHQLLLAPLSPADCERATDPGPDCAPAIQEAIDACAQSGGGVVELGSGTFVLRGPVVLRAGTTLRGQWAGPHYSSLKSGTVIEVRWGAGKDDGPAQFTLEESTTLSGLTVFYPEQDVANIQPYPWTVQGHGTHLNVMDVTLANPYKGIDFATYSHEMHYIRNVYGCPLKVGVSLDQCTDIGRVENVHFNPNAWTRCGAPNAPTGAGGGKLMEYMQANLIAFEIGRSDWEMMVNTFVFGANIGYRFYASTRGVPGPTNGDFLGIASDWSVRAVVVEESQAPGLLITNGQFVGSPASEAVIDILPTHTGVVQLANCAFWGPHGAVIRNAGPGQVSLSQCNFVQWDARKTGVAAVEFAAGALSLQNCIFRERKLAIHLGKSCAGAVVLGCQSRGELKIESETEGPVEKLGNLVFAK
jgi:hypothetical protein